MVGRDSSVGIATDYGLDGQGIESRWGARFSAPVQTGPGGHPASCTMGTGSFLGVKSGRGVTLTSHLLPSAVGHERVELYLYSPYGPYGLYRALVPVQECTLLKMLNVWSCHSRTFQVRSSRNQWRPNVCHRRVSASIIIVAKQGNWSKFPIFFSSEPSPLCWI